MSYTSLHYIYGPSPTVSVPSSVAAAPFYHPRVFSFPHLLARTRQANARIRAILIRWRECNYPTHKAKRRASSLKLRVDTIKAHNLEQKHVSTIPLPLLDLEPTPPPAKFVYPPGCATIHLEEVHGSPVIPREEDYSDCCSSASSMSISSESSATSFEEDATVIAAEPPKRPTRPVLRCIIPPTPRKSPLIERSYFSPDSEYSAVTLTSVVDEQNSAQNALIAPQAVYYSQVALSVPEDVSGRPLSWGCSETQTTFSLSSPTSSSGRSSSAPLTPEDAVHPQQLTVPVLPVRIKRKSAAMEEDSDTYLSSCDEIRCIFAEKRPKFERKSWVGIGRGQPIKRPSVPAPFLYSSAKWYRTSGAPSRF